MSQRVGVGELIDGDRRGRLAAEVAGLVVRLGAQLDAADVPDPHERAIGPRPDDDLLELLGLFEPPLGRDRVLEPLPLGDRRGADLAGGGLAVLRLDRVDDLLRVDLLLGHPIGVEPDPHRVLAAEDVDLADAPDSLQDVDDVDLGVVVQEVGVEPAVGAGQVHDAHHVGGRLLRLDADLGDLRRQGGLGRVHLVLHVDRGDVLRVADVEGHDDPADALAGAVRGHVDHALGAVDLLLDRRRDRVGDRLGVGPGVGGGDLHLRAARGRGTARSAARRCRCRRPAPSGSPAPWRRWAVL